MLKGNYINGQDFIKHIEKFHVAEKEKKEMHKLVGKVEQWFNDKGLAKSDPKMQALKLFEEFGELAEGLDVSNPEIIIDALGDMQVVLIGLHLQLDYKIFIPNLEAQEIKHNVSQLLMFIKYAGKLAEGLAKEKPDLVLEALTDLQLTIALLHLQLGYNALATLSVAYNVIKDRTGKVINGNFRKTADI